MNGANLKTSLSVITTFVSSMIGKILCKLGHHDWLYMTHFTEDNKEFTLFTCSRCQAETEVEQNDIW